MHQLAHAGADNLPLSCFSRVGRKLCFVVGRVYECA